MSRAVGAQGGARTPVPTFVKDSKIELSDNSRKVIEERYLRRGPDGSPIESIPEMFWRVARHVAEPDAEYNGDVEATARIFYELLTGLRFMPNSPTFTGANTPLGQLAACFVLPISDDMGREPDGIFQTLRDAALIQQTGGGNGFSFSRLRPRGDIVHTSGGKATGPVGFLQVYDVASGVVSQGGVRRGANMAVLRVDHPDIEEFIRCKAEEGQITNFNISVGITDDFMRAVEADEDFDLINPRDGKVWKTVRAREIFNLIAQGAHRNGEPGVLFLDTANRDNPLPHLGEYEATNPCVTGDTLIYTADGLQRAKALAASKNPQTVVVDGRFGVDRLQPASQVFPTGVKDVYRVTTREGYEVRLTANHQVMTPRGWVKVCNLKRGDKIFILNQRGAFGKEGSRELGLVLGWLVGDGTINQVRAVLSFFRKEKGELAPMFAEAVTTLVDADHQNPPLGRRYPVGVTTIPARDEARVQSERLKRLVAEYGLDEEKLQVPEVVFIGTEAMQRAFLQALFTADGSVQDGGEKGCSVRLTSVRYDLLQDVQRLLLNFGIASRIYRERRPAGNRKLPDGQGGHGEYWCQAYHELVISKDNLLRFAERIGFLSQAKQSALIAYLKRMTRGPYHEDFTAEVVSITYEGRETVYDLTQPTTHSFVANGVVVHNCGEQFLLPYENCCLGSVNLAQHMTEGDKVDWEKLRESVELATHFLDNVVTANKYVPAVPQLKEAALRSRRIGLGIMGLADMMYRLGIRYGSEEAQEFAAQVMEFIRFHCMRASIALAQERGPFPAIKGSIYDPDDLRWTPPKPLAPYTRLEKWGRPYLDWEEITEGIRRYGIRNAAQTTIAPTGTTSTVAGCEGYGCEPVFALAYIRHFKDGDRDVPLTYVSPLFERALSEAGLDETSRQRIYDEVLRVGTCQHIAELPEHIRHTFVVSQDITAEEHVRMQAALQAFVDSSISKTCNLPPDATVQDVERAFLLAWKLGCKGLTVYRIGSRQQVVLETRETLERKKRALESGPPLLKWQRGPVLKGWTFKQRTPVGTAYVTVNAPEDEPDMPHEVFINVGKAGSEISAVSEALGRLISLCLRLTSPRSSRDRAIEIVNELYGIGGGRQIGFGQNRVRSLPDGIAQALMEYLKRTSTEGEAEELPARVPEEQLPLPLVGDEQRYSQTPIGDLCPNCGQASLIQMEGCRTCVWCGYSEC